MKEITIKVPDGIEEKAFTEFALVFVERKLRETVKATEVVEQKFKDDIDEVRTINKLTAKFAVEEKEI